MLQIVRKKAFFATSGSSTVCVSSRTRQYAQTIHAAVSSFHLILNCVRKLRNLTNTHSATLLLVLGEDGLDVTSLKLAT